MSRSPRRRIVLWGASGVAVVVVGLIAVLAVAAPASQTSASSPLLGKPAPRIDGTSLRSGRAFRLSSLHGRWVVVNFSASWCVPCRQELPELHRLAAWGAGRSAPVPTTVLTVAYDPSDLRSLEALLASQGDTWPAVDAPGADVAYGLHGIPESYLVDPDGTVVEKVVGGVNAAQIERVVDRYSPQLVPPATSRSGAG